MHIATNPTPLVRFPEFIEDWTEVRLGDFLVLTLRAVSKPAERFLAVGVRSHCRGTFQRESLDPEDISMDTLYVVREGDLIVNITFAWEGAVAIAKAEDDGGLVSHRFPTYLFNQEITGPDFFQHVFVQRRFSYLLGVISPGGAGRNRVLNQKDFLNLAVRLPKLVEQEKIAAFLNAVDEKIELLARKKELLLKYKSGLMQQLFNQKIRFKDDDGKEFPDWRTKTLGDISQNIMYGMNSAATAYDGKNGYIRITDIDEAGRFVPSPMTTPDGTLEDRYRLKPGDILFARTGATVGKSYYYTESDGKLFFAGFLIRFSVVEGDPFFIYLQTHTHAYNKWVQEVSTRSGQPGINAEEFKSLKIGFPCLAEQTKIATFVSALDQKINIVNERLMIVKKFKKALLQQMFV